MTWSYSGDPTSDPKDEVRFLIGDTDSDDQLIEDEEINYLLDKEGGIILEAAARAAGAIAAKFAREADKDIGDYSISASQRAEAYRELEKALSKESKDSRAKSAIPFAGGISRDDKKQTRQDTDRVDPKFRKDLMENEGQAAEERSVYYGD